jgi:alpha-amylase
VNPGPVVRPTLPQAYDATGRAAAGDVAVQLFEWSWPDIARECELHLGPMGYKAALVSPPQEHITGTQWWTRYQPVSYSIDNSRSGTRAQFIDMLARCTAEGVDIYVDAVINHMTAGSGTGTNGTVYTKYAYPGLYSIADFHTACGINDYGNPAQVQDCELVGLSDLNTSLPTVQQKIADYLVALADLGVAGFRIDAAKHIQPVQLDSIVTKVNRARTNAGASRPYLFLEVIDMGSEGVPATAYYGLGKYSGGGADISEFKFRGIGDKFLGAGGQKVADLTTFSQGNWGLMPSDKAMSFMQNHDTQRSGGLRWSDGVVARLANVFMLAEGYGYPMIMSGYSFDPSSGAARDAGPPAPNGTAAGQNCTANPATAPNGVWLCEHRDAWLRQMIRFRRTVTGTARNANWDNGTQAVAFSRGDKGFVAINNGTAAVAANIPSGLAPGTYCDLLTGGLVGGACAGTSVSVLAGGFILISLEARTAVVLLQGDQP